MTRFFPSSSAAAAAGDGDEGHLTRMSPHRTNDDANLLFFFVFLFCFVPL